MIDVLKISTDSIEHRCNGSPFHKSGATAWKEHPPRVANILPVGGSKMKNNDSESLAREKQPLKRQRKIKLTGMRLQITRTSNISFIHENQSFHLLPTDWLHSSVSRAWHRHSRGRGFESCWSHMNFLVPVRDNYLNCPVKCEEHIHLYLSCITHTSYTHFFHCRYSY